MQFKVIKTQKFEFRTIFDSGDESLQSYRIGSNSDIYSDASLCIEGTYLTIDLNIKTGIVIGISGFLGEIENYPIITTSKVKASKGILIYNKRNSLIKGIGYEIGYKGWINFDRKRNILVIYIQGATDKGEWIQINLNIYVRVFQGKICEIRVCMGDELF